MHNPARSIFECLKETKLSAISFRSVASAQYYSTVFLLHIPIFSLWENKAHVLLQRHYFVWQLFLFTFRPLGYFIHLHIGQILCYLSERYESYWRCCVTVWNIILPIVFYGCETWSLTLREELRLWEFENRVLRRIFGPRRYELTA